MKSSVSGVGGRGVEAAFIEDRPAVHPVHPGEEGLPAEDVKARRRSLRSDAEIDRRPVAVGGLHQIGVYAFAKMNKDRDLLRRAWPAMKAEIAWLQGTIAPGSNLPSDPPLFSNPFNIVPQGPGPA